MKERVHSEGGFSVVELLITLIVIGVVFGAFTTTFTSIQNINKKALDVNSASVSAFSKLEEYENKNFTTLPTTTPGGTLVEVEDFSSTLNTTLEAPRVGKVYVNTISPTLRQVVVTVEYGSGPAKRVIQYATFIQRSGLGR